MRILLLVKELFPYLAIASCALLFTFLYVIHDHQLPAWRLFIDSDTDKHNSTPHHRSYIVNDYDDTINDMMTVSSNKQAPVQKSVARESTEKLNDRKALSFQQDYETENSALDGHTYTRPNTSDKNDFPSDKTNIIFNSGNRVSWTSQQEEYKTRNDKDFRVDTNILLLADILDKKLSSVSVNKQADNIKPTCESDFKLANSCDNNKCLQTELPKNVTARVEQLVTPRKLQMSLEEHAILHQMADQVTGNYDIILLTAASSNHFLESQALLKNLHENVYPHLKNFTLVFYNLGLTEHERNLMDKYCKCQVVDFPFHKFPHFLVSLKCYSWKPVLIKAHLNRTNTVFWMDASIRFSNSSRDFHELVKTSRERGVLIGRSSSESSFRTYRSMYHFFGDEPCAYLTLVQAKATFGIYHREYFVDRVILEPWVACALNKDCMCPETNISADCENSKMIALRYYQGKGPIVYGLCHRFDQSAISLILHKLYQDLYAWVAVKTGSFLSIQRKHTVVYFPNNLNNT